MATVVANVIVGTGTLTYGNAGAAAATELGYTEDGVTIEYTAEINDVDVEEETFSINRVITKEEVLITANIAENLLANLEEALSGGLTGGAGIVNLGAGALRTMSVQFVGGGPTGVTTRTIYAAYAHPVGPVGMSYKKGEKTLIPVAFKAYQGTSAGNAVVITDA